MVFFTTLSFANWQEYGRWTLPSWERLGHPVVLFLDEAAAGELADFTRSRSDWLTMRPIYEPSLAFQSAIPADKRAHARTADGRYNYRRDIAKFAWPAFAFCQGLRELAAPCVWMDADVVVRTAPPAEVVFPRRGVAFLERTKYPRSHPHTESGLIGFDLAPEPARRLAETMEQILISGEVYELDHWHDCSVFDAARARLAGAMRFVSISRDVERDHVFDDTLSEWLHHYRGPDRKKEAADDARSERDLPPLP